MMKKLLKVEKNDVHFILYKTRKNKYKLRIIEDDSDVATIETMEKYKTLEEAVKSLHWSLKQI